MRVKICGITNSKDALAAVEAGASALGFILYPQSPRYVTPEIAAEISAVIPPFVQRVAVTVNLPLEEIRRMEEKLLFDLWQLHGDEAPGDCSLLSPRRTIRALRMNGPQAGVAARYPDIAGFLLDAPAANYGGTGRVFDWALAREFCAGTTKPVILSGGLTVENVAEAIRVVQPYAVDVSSGVERAPGLKDHDKLKRFIDLCRQF